MAPPDGSTGGQYHLRPGGSSTQGPDTDALLVPAGTVPPAGATCWRWYRRWGSNPHELALIGV